ncbi:chitinase-3-like protein 1 [Amphibalanus amphitrite]|uniref:chitinase-3-like protein 1 n=1 Tax=Amphibalanus amphitrite TaxID=1232801 RepID=UPI001C903667|nr:chitinase-3-like protein 1 [Amphibalanus amphitrite]
MQVQGLLLLLLGCLALSGGQQPPAPRRLVCYYTNWARYRKPLAAFTPENISPHLCTHLHYAFANTNSQLRVGPSDPFSDFTKGGYKQMVALKKVNPALRVLIMLGGSNSPQQMAFEEIAADDSKMKRFVSEAIKYVRMHNFDGIDLDWKVPRQKEGHARLLELFASEVKKESETSGKERLIISTTIPGNVTMLMEDFDVPRIAKAVDYVNALVYQFRSCDGNRTSHHSPLFTTDPESTDFVDFIVQMYLSSGADPAKFNLAVPAFGKTYTLSDPAVSGFGAPTADLGFPGKLTGGAGALSFTEICEHVSMDGWTAHRPLPDAAGPYAVGGDQWVAYDDQFMMRRKGAYIREKGLGGAAVWSLSQDDFRGFCTGRQFPLIEALKLGMYEDTPVTTTTPSPPTTPEYDNSAVFTCPSDGRFPKPDNCREFYICSDRVADVKSCEDGTVFDAERSFCREDAPCMDTEPPRVTQFRSTPPPVTEARLTVPPPLLRAGGDTDTVVIPAAEPTTTRPIDMKVDMDMDVKTDGELQQVLQLVQELGGIDSLRTLLSALRQPSVQVEAGAPSAQVEAVAPSTPVDTGAPSRLTEFPAPQPAVAQVVTTDGGRTRIRVHVTVELEPF